MIFSKKRRYPYLYQPLSEIRPLAVARVRCYWRPERGKRTYVLYSLMPLTYDFGDRCVTVHLVFTAGSAFPKPPRVLGIWSRVRLFRNVRPVRNSS